MIRIPNFSFTRVEMQCYLPLRKFGMREVKLADFHVGDEVDGKSQLEEDGQLAVLLFEEQVLVFVHTVCTEAGMLNGNVSMSVPRHTYEKPRYTHVRRGPEKTFYFTNNSSERIWLCVLTNLNAQRIVDFTILLDEQLAVDDTVYSFRIMGSIDESGRIYRLIFFHTENGDRF